MAIKKSTPRIPPDTTSMKVSPGLTVLGKIIPGKGNRAPLSDATIKQLQTIIKANNAAKSKAAIEAKENAKIIKKQNKPKVVRGGSSKPKPVVKVTPPRGGRGGGVGGAGGTGGLYGNMFKR